MFRNGVNNVCVCINVYFFFRREGFYYCKIFRNLRIIELVSFFVFEFRK